MVFQKRGAQSALVFMVAAAIPVAVSAAEPAPRPELFRKLIDCRAITDTQARLACFDASVLAIDAAEKNKEIVVIDRQAVRKARKTLFGLTLPSFDVFGDKGEGDEEEEGFSSIESVLARVGRNAEGRYVFTLDDGAKWVQVEQKRFVSDPKPGTPIKIRRAALGSFLANVGSQTAIRVRREN